MKINGRLGNQLFQIATAYTMAKKTSQPFVMVFNQSTEYESHYKEYFRDIKFISTNEVPVDIKYFSERRPGMNTFKFNENLLSICAMRNIMLDGYFQTGKYFNNYFNNLKKIILKKKVQINNGYFIHVRRGDYLTDARFQIDYTKYFKIAIEYFPKDANYFVVSDDIEFCKNYDLFKNLKKEFIELDPIDTIHFMSGCRGGICANSSFSWWGAYLGQREIVTMPRQWFHDGMDKSDLFFENVKVIDF